MQLSKNLKFYFPVVILLGLAAYSSYSLVKAHFIIEVDKLPQYDFYDEIAPVRGGIYCSAFGREPYPLVRSMPAWRYRLDPVLLKKSKVIPPGEKTPRSPKAQAKTIATQLGLPPKNVFAMLEKTSGPGYQNQYLGVSDSKTVHDVLNNRSIVAGIKIEETYFRKYFESNRLSHVIKGVNEKFNRYLCGTRGEIRGKRDANGNLIKDKIELNIPPKHGADVILTVDNFLQKTVEEELAAGVVEYGAGSGWCVILDVKTGKVLAMATYPEMDLQKTYDIKDPVTLNKVIGYVYEPGSVMKVITAAAAIDCGFAKPDTRYSTKRDEKDSNGANKYYRLPNDSHKMDPVITVKDAIVESSNIVIGKLGYDMGPKRVYGYMRRFGFGRRVGIELPREEIGILWDYRKWNKATMSRAPIGQGISVTPIQMASAYQTIANDGIRKKPYIVDKIVDAEKNDLLSHQEDPGESVIKASTAHAVREMMLDVTTPKGTARRAKVKGYSVAGKTGTAQKTKEGVKGYLPGLYIATFCGIVPSGVVKRYPDDPEPVPPKIVVLVSLDFDEKRRYHAGGNSAGPVFKRITEKAMRYLEVVPDRLDELDEEDY